MRDCHRGAEQIAAGQDQQRPRFQETELTKQQHCRDQVIEDERRLIDWNKGRNRRELHFRERNCRNKDRGGDGHDDQRLQRRPKASPSPHRLDE
jgi:hypothetical protein